MKTKLCCILLCFVLSSCERANHPKESKITSIKENNPTPTVVITDYNLISNSTDDRKKDAAEILRLKRKWPQIMQAPTFAGFDTLLAKDFTFVDNGRLFNRADYINDRMKTSDWKITFVKYDNLSLQFFENVALLTYRNHVRNENTKTKVIEIEHINWSDIYTKENNQWKIKSAHVIEIEIEKATF